MISLYVIQGNDQGRRFELSHETLSIGRDPGNQIQLRDAEVSRKHAHIAFTNEQYRLIDDESANGVYVNGKRCKDQVLRNGDQILLGRSLLLFANRPSTAGISDKGQQGRLAVQALDAESEGQIYVHSLPVRSEQSLFQSPVLSGSDDGLPQADAHLKMMYHTSLVTSQTLDIGVLLNRILDLIFEWVRIDRGCIMFFDEESQQLIPQASRLSKNAENSASSMSINKSIVGYVIKRREGVLTNDTRRESRTDASAPDTREVICVPMMGRYGLVGVIYIDTLMPTETSPGETPKVPYSLTTLLTPDHLRLMVAIGHQAALAVEDTRYYQGMIQGERLAVVGQTITTLSHHIKNILQGISGGSHLIEMGLDRHEEEIIRKGWDIVQKNQTRISQLILDMLTFSKDREPAYEFGDLRETVRDVVQLMTPRAHAKKVEIRFEMPDSFPCFFFDPEQIHRAVTNLATNAIDAIVSKDVDEEDVTDVDWEMDTLFSKNVAAKEFDRKGFLRIKLEVDPDRSVVLIRVDDSGPGIPAERRADLFRPFYSEKKGRGTGLGLSVAHKIVQEHSGLIRIDDSPFGGASFVIELPLRLFVDDPVK